MTERKRPRVFLSHSAADKFVARELAHGLAVRGVQVGADDWELGAGDSIVRRLEKGASSSDVVLVLLSKSSAQSRWVQIELGAALAGELRDRAIRVIPALLEDCEIPASLADRAVLDLRGDIHLGIQKLIDQLGTAPLVEFWRLDGREFESLVADLLHELGFSVQSLSASQDVGMDLAASFRSRDPFGSERVEKWLVQVKLYKEGRFSVSALRNVVRLLSGSQGGFKFLLVTNGILTSAARDFLAEADGPDIRVIDGNELATLLITHPDVTRRHFSGTAAS